MRIENCASGDSIDGTEELRDPVVTVGFCGPLIVAAGLDKLATYALQ